MMTRRGVRQPFLRYLRTLINRFAQKVLSLLSITMQLLPHLKDIPYLSTLHQKACTGTLKVIKKKYHPKIILKK